MRHVKGLRFIDFANAEVEEYRLSQKIKPNRVSKTLPLHNFHKPILRAYSKYFLGTYKTLKEMANEEVSG